MTSENSRSCTVSPSPWVSLGRLSQTSDRSKLIGPDAGSLAPRAGGKPFVSTVVNAR